MALGFDMDRYLENQVKSLSERTKKFSKLYLEIGGRLCQDTHTSRVIPGYKADTKLRALQSFGDFELIYCVSARDIENQKRRKNKEGQLLADFVVQDLENIVGLGIEKPKIAMTLFKGQKKALEFKQLLEEKSFQVYVFIEIDSYPHTPNIILSEIGFGQYDLIETTHDLVAVSAPGGDSGKMGFCISQLYLNNNGGVPCGFAKFETLPVWNLDLDHPLNISYEFATVNTRDDNLLDELFLQSKGNKSVTYNRDVGNYHVLSNLFLKIFGTSLYGSPTEMGINMIKEGIIDDQIVRAASMVEIKRRFKFYESQANLGERNKIDYERAKELITKYDLKL